MSVPLDVVLLYDTGPLDSDEQGRCAQARAAAAAPDGAADAGLVARARRGEYAAFEELVRRYRNDVVGLAYHYLRDREEAWDISQEVFVKVHGSLGRFRGDASFKTWILRITANRCKDYFKKRRLKTVVFDEAAPGGRGAGDLASGIPGPAEALEARELGEAIQAALDTLPEKHRTAFVLREFEGLSYEEMAGVMGCRMGTVMSRLHHARKKLRKALAGIGAPSGRVVEGR